MSAKRFFRPIFIWTLYVCATLQFIRYYVVHTMFYLNMPRYLAGRERLPFQERILPVLLMWPLNHSHLLMRSLAHPRGGFDAPSAATTETLAFYILSLVSFSIASVFVVKLYGLLTRTGSLGALVFPLFMVITLWTYVVHIDADFSYPYDMPSVAFFAAGLWAIYSRRYVLLAILLLIGTANRETTLFLIGIYALDAASRPTPDQAPHGTSVSPSMLAVRDRLDFRRIPWPRVALLFALWLAVKLPLAWHFRHNDNSENFVRIYTNIGRLRPRLWPALLNVCGYLLPIVILFARQLRPLRFANYLYILPLWFAVMFYTGVILETRIYGELCSYTALAVVLLLEEHVAQRTAAARPLGSVTEHAVR